MRARLVRLCRQMCAGLVERDEPARLLLLAALAGEHALLLGPPGTAKSELARRLRGILADARYFERLLTKFSIPEELYGPLSIKRLEQDEYHRLTEGYLPSASVAFLDEIFNANSAILNALLTLLNEREFDNGTERVLTPLVSVIGASNLIPEGTELAALYDRFLFRYQIEPVSEQGFEALLALTEAGPATTAPVTATTADSAGQDAKEGAEAEDGGAAAPLTAAELQRVRYDARAVVIPQSVKVMIGSLRKALVAKQLYVSDRRWTKIAAMLRVAAWCDGRGEVALSDCWLMMHCLWNRPEQAPIAQQLVRSTIAAVLVDEPKRYEAIARAFEEEVAEDQQRKEQVCNARSEPLWYDESGAQVTEPHMQVQSMNHRGELLFVAPKQMPIIRGKTAYTLEELWNGWFCNQPNGMQKLEAWGRNPVYHVTVKTERKRVEQPRRYAAEHLAGRQQQVQEVLGDVADFLQAIEGLQGGGESLWVNAALSREVLDTMEGAGAMLASVRGRLTQVLSDIEALPRCET